MYSSNQTEFTVMVPRAECDGIDEQDRVMVMDMYGHVCTV